MSNRSMVSVTEKLGFASLTEAISLNNANVVIIDPVHHTAAKHFPLSRLMSKERRLQLENADFDIRVQHVKYDVLIDYLSAHKFSGLYKAGTSQVMDALTMTPIEDDDDLIGTINSHIMSRKLEGVMLLCQTTKPPGNPNRVQFQSIEPPEQPSPSKKRVLNPSPPPDGPSIKRRKLKEADSGRAKASGGRNKKDEDSSDSNTGSDVVRRRDKRDRGPPRARSVERGRLETEAQLKKARDEEELVKAKKEKEAYERMVKPGALLDNKDDHPDRSPDTDPEDDSEDEEATTAKELAKEKKERLKALLNAKTRDGLSARVGTAMEHCTLEEWTSAAVFFGVSINDLQNKRAIKLPASWGIHCDFTPYQLTDAYILYSKELSSDNGGIFANVMGMGKTRAMVLAVIIGHVHFKNWMEVRNAREEGDATKHNAHDDNDKPCPTASERTFRCACEKAPSFDAEPRQAATMVTGWGRAPDAWKNEVVAMDLANSKWCDLRDPLALRFCFFSDFAPEHMGIPTKEEVVEMRINTTPAITKALAHVNKSVRPRSYTLKSVVHEETVEWEITDANMPAVHPEATEHRPAPSAARFVLVCNFGKVEKRVFRAYNDMDVTVQRTITYKGAPMKETKSIHLPGHVTVWGRTVFD
ncbi:hypothetical protein HBI18_243890 [Parastagonospora nodorum]|nr:hypothetical protein HBI18_243890 [Parastagonospora nodorum]